ncbi:Troponin I, fast skeletal muscle Troponin I, fast-twitch isoform [Channa argus]|uniref:Troponin I, fast skeletal muscle n=2 Tax=Channa argus TaxID=215402 RepID=A0A6G1QTU2_CHAAH|nr:Troponin I, fast skeletal muscle Troponin I, fast-twitch isoform [Channa argus]
MSSSRRHHLKSLMLSIAKGLLEEEEMERERERSRYMAENCPTLSMPRTMQELQELCREIHHKIDVIDEERYDLELKVNKANKEIDDLKIKVQDLMGKFKKPVLRKVRMSADAMLKALLGSKHTVNLDLRANLKQVKKEVKEEDKELRDVGDWRKNIEDKSGMDGRKKMFEGEVTSDPTANMATEKRLSARRKHTLKSCMLGVATTLLEAESEKKAEEREKFLADKCPPLELPYSRDELVELCNKLHKEIDISEEERYSIEFKLNMVLNEVRDLNIKIVDLRGKFKRPRLKKVRMSADAMLKALLGSKHTVNMDLRANLKQVKKEVKEEDKQLRDVGDWRKNIEDKSDRKKMFDS